MRRPGLRLLAIASILLAAVSFSAAQETPAAADTLSISQVDTAGLLVRQTVDIYLSVTDPGGNPVEGLDAGSFRVFESPDGETFEERPVVRFRPAVNVSQGIAFMLLVDNSGSMYETLDGRDTQAEGERRITHAKSAIRSFLGSITSPRDRIALASFNTLYTEHAGLTADRMKIGSLLEEISRPAREDAYTELYASLTLASEAMGRVRGRKVVIVLSDGENYPTFQRSGRPHPEYGERTYLYTDPVDVCRREGVSIFAVNFGLEKDQNLQSIARETGGAVFEARGGEELDQVYRLIRERVLREYQLRYRAGMTPAEVRTVRVTIPGDRAERQYLAGTVLGRPMDGPAWYLLAPLLAALLLWLLLLRIRPPAKRRNPSLEVLGSELGRPSTRLFSIQGKNTVIGASQGADFTIAGAPSVRQQHATIVFDEKNRAYTLVGDGEVSVNNKPATRRKLESGDVINIGGTTLVFDDDVAEPRGGAKK